MVPLYDHANLAAQVRRELAAAVATLPTLQEVIQWGLSLPEESTILDVVVQDEYTHDVVMKWRDSYHVVFDAT